MMFPVGDLPPMLGRDTAMKPDGLDAKGQESGLAGRRVWGDRKEDKRRC